MVINKTNAVETRIQAVSPVSRVGSSAAGAAASSTGAGVATACTSGDAAAVVSTVVVTSSDGADAVTSSAQATEPPKSAPDRLSASSIFFIRVPQPNFASYSILCKLYAKLNSIWTCFTCTNTDDLL